MWAIPRDKLDILSRTDNIKGTTICVDPRIVINEDNQCWSGLKIANGDDIVNILMKCLLPLQSTFILLSNNISIYMN